MNVDYVNIMMFYCKVFLKVKNVEYVCLLLVDWYGFEMSVKIEYGFCFVRLVFDIIVDNVNDVWK